jgi:hypothetical protein
MWEEKYNGARSMAEVLLDLFGYLPATDVEPALTKALEFNDPRLKHFALSSLLRHRKKVDPKYIADVSRSIEMRWWLYRRLKELGMQTEVLPHLHPR